MEKVRKILTKKAVNAICMNVADMTNADQVRKFGDFLKFDKDFLEEAVDVFHTHYEAADQSVIWESIDSAVARTSWLWVDRD